MTDLTKIGSLPPKVVAKSFLPVVERKICVAISSLMFLGAVLSYVLGASWVIPLFLFTLALVPAIPVGRIAATAKNRIAQI